MKLRPIPFIDDLRYRIDRDGQVYSLEIRKQGRGRIISEWTKCTPLILKDAQSFARVSLNYLIPLVAETSEAIHRTNADGSTQTIILTYTMAQQVRHDPATPMEPHPLYGDAILSGSEWVGACPRLVGDREHGWYCVTTNSGIVHLLHGASTAAEIFDVDR
jgi:hypothetical protein